jgi:hypothetical protein
MVRGHNINKRQRDNHVYYLGSIGTWWAATEYDATYAYIRYMDTGHTGVGENYNYKSSGLSVRCLQDK